MRRCSWLLLAWPALLGACRLISLEQLRVSSFPSERNQVISPADLIRLEFSIAPDRPSAEKLLKVSSYKGELGGDLSWQGSRLIFAPAPALPLNTRLLLSFSGNLAAADGRSFTVAVEVPFYVGSASPPPRLEDHQPPDGATAGVLTPLVLTFSEAMDADSFAQGFSLDPDTDFRVSWSADSRTITVSPRERWASLTLYSWQLGDTVRASAGAELGLPHSGSFLVQEDSEAPEVLGAEPAIFQNGTFSFPGGTLNELQARDCIYLRFSEAVSLSSLQEAFSLDPSIRGHFIQADPEEFAFEPEECYQVGKTHQLRISSELEDLAGNRMAADYRQWFLPDIPVLAVLSITPFGQTAITSFNSPDPVSVTLAPGQELRLSIEFSEAFDPDSMATVPFLVSCENFFPASLLQPALRQAAWPNSTTLELVFAGLATATAPAQCYYRLTLPGGSSGIGNASGSYLEDSVWVLFVESSD
jgi:hypothetical protein